MTVVASDLRSAFPEFASTTTYPDAQIDFWLAQAPNQLNAYRLGSSLDLATMLFVAHNIVLSARAAATALTGSAAGGSTGLVASKSVVGAGSVSYDVTVTAVQGAGSWNLTSYGQRLQTLLKGFNTGPVYLPARPSGFGLFGMFRR